MKNRFNINEEEKNRIKGLHYDEYENRKIGMWEQTNTGATGTTVGTSTNQKRIKFIKSLIEKNDKITKRAFTSGMDAMEYYLLLDISTEWKELFRGVSFKKFKEIVNSLNEGVSYTDRILEQNLPRHIRKGSKEHADWVRSQQGDGSDEILEALLVGAQRLTRFVEDTRGGGSRDDLRDIQEYIENNIIQFIGTTEGRG